MINLPSSLNWFYWGVALMVGLPLLVVVFGEVAEWCERRGLTRFKKPIDLVRNSCLFLFFLMILLRHVVGLPREHMAVKIVETAFWITVLNAALVIFDVLTFKPDAKDWRAQAPKLLIDLGRLFVVAFGAALVVSYIWKVDLQALLAAFGVGSLVIGLALQDTFSSLFSGITLVSQQTFKPGDWIRVGDVEGQVRSINWRSVTLANETGDLTILPNGTIARDKLVVLGADQGWKRVQVDLKLAFMHPPEQVKAMLLEAVAATKGIMPEPAPIVRVAALEDFAINYAVSFCLQDAGEINAVKSEFLSNAWYIADRHEILFPARLQEISLPPGSLPLKKSVPAEIAEHLSKLGTFQRPIEALMQLTTHARGKLYRAGEELISAGQRGQFAYVVASGTARATEPSDEGTETVLDQYATGDLILFKPFFRGGTAPCAVLATTDLDVIVIPIADMEAALARDAHLGHQVERLLTLREEASARVHAKAHHGQLNGHGDAADRVQIMKDLFRV